jgi:predicted amidophosphoribosyltransferase
MSTSEMTDSHQDPANADQVCVNCGDPCPDDEEFCQDCQDQLEQEEGAEPCKP